MKIDTCSKSMLTQMSKWKLTCALKVIIDESIKIDLGVEIKIVWLILGQNKSIKPSKSKSNLNASVSKLKSTKVSKLKLIGIYAKIKTNTCIKLEIGVSVKNKSR